MVMLILSLVFALLISVFALQNAAPVPIKFFWTVTEVPLVLVILGATLIGALIVFMLAVWREFRAKHKQKTKLLKTEDNLQNQEANKEKSNILNVAEEPIEEKDNSQ